MRGRKSYNIRNVEAHMNAFQKVETIPVHPNPYQFSRNFMFQTNTPNIIPPSEQQSQNEFINAKFGVSKYASNLVSGKMFKPLKL
jgi:hypothetical protein